MGSSHSVPKSTKRSSKRWSLQSTNKSSKRWSLRSIPSVTPEPPSSESERRFSSLDSDMSQYLWYPPERKPFIKRRPKQLTQDEEEANRKRFEVAHVLLHDASLRNRHYENRHIPLHFETYEKLDGTRYRKGEFPVYSSSTKSNNIDSRNTGEDCPDATFSRKKGFFSLPPELRQQIYSYIFPPPALQQSPIPLIYSPTEQSFRYPVWSNAYTHPIDDPIMNSRKLNSYLVVCRQFNNELSEYLYGWRAGFEVQSNAYAFIQHIGPHNARYIRHFRMSWKEDDLDNYPYNSTLTTEQESFRRLCTALKTLERAAISITVKNSDIFYSKVRECMTKILTRNGLETQVNITVRAPQRPRVETGLEYILRNRYRDVEPSVSRPSASSPESQCLKGCDSRCYMPANNKSGLALYTRMNLVAPILALPIEVRRQIYDYVTTHNPTPDLATRSDCLSIGEPERRSKNTVSSAVTITKGDDGYRSMVSNGHRAPTRCTLYGIMFACRQTYTELHNEVYRQTHFHVPARSLSWLELIPFDNLKLIRKLALSYDADSPRGSSWTINPTGNLRTLNSKIHMFASLLENWMDNPEECGELQNLEIWVHRFSVPFFYYLRHAVRRLIAVTEDFNRLKSLHKVKVRVITYEYVNDDEVYWTKDMTESLLEKEEPYAWDCETHTWKTWDVVQEKARNCEPMSDLEFARICEGRGIL